MGGQDTFFLPQLQADSGSSLRVPSLKPSMRWRHPSLSPVLFSWALPIYGIGTRIGLTGRNMNDFRTRGKMRGLRTVETTLSKAKSATLNLPAKWLKAAESQCAEKGARLTPARLQAYAELVSSERPLTAYELIAKLEKRQKKKIAPLTVYRHLDFLITVGLVHRLESNQSYLPCDHPEHAHESQYLMCTSCGHVDELESKRIENLLSKLADQHGFQPSNSVVEVTGLCGNCANQAH